MRKKRKRQWKALEAVLLLGTLLCLLAYPAWGAAGTVHIRLKDFKSPGSVRAGVEVQLYQVGTVDENHRPAFAEEYAIGEYPQTGGALDAAAKTLAAGLKGEPAYRKQTDEEGTAYFEAVEQGIYLVHIPEKNPYGAVEPFLFQLPYFEEVNGQMEGPVYQVEAVPKAVPNPVLPTNTPSLALTPGASITPAPGPSVTVTPGATVTPRISPAPTKTPTKAPTPDFPEGYSHNNGSGGGAYPSGGGESPKTGDASEPVFYLLLAAASAVGIGMALRRKRL